MGMHQLLKKSVKDRSTRTRAGSVLLGAFCVVVMTACATAPPENIENICAVFEEKGSWYKAAMKSEKRWGTPVHVQMSIMRQESSYPLENAALPRRTP